MGCPVSSIVKAHALKHDSSRNKTANQNDKLIKRSLKQMKISYDLKTFKTSRGLNVFSPGNMLMLLNWEDYCRWETIVFNFNKARFPAGLIPYTYCRQHEFHTNGKATRTTLLLDLNFFRDKSLLFEERLVSEVYKLESVNFRRNFGIQRSKCLATNKPVWFTLVLMDREEFQAWESSASVEEINAIDEEKVGMRVEYPARLSHDCTTSSQTRTKEWVSSQDIRDYYQRCKG